MKKVLLVLALLATVTITGCGKKEEPIKNDVPQQQNSQQQQQEVVDKNKELLDKGFEERTREARDWMNQGDQYGIETLGYVSKEHFVSNAELEKKDDYYLMKLTIDSSKLYDKEVIENAFNLAQENGEYSFENFTFKKNNDDLIHFESKNEELEKSYNNLKKDAILADSPTYGLVKFMITPGNSEKYCVTKIQFVGAPGFMITEEEKKMEVVLLPNDNVKINVNHGESETTMSVEELYNKALNGEHITLEGYSDENEIDLSGLGMSVEYYGGSQNAVEFGENEVIINYTKGGV